jgi:class 3 adenylate cyclase/Tol biopolymer transport system component
LDVTLVTQQSRALTLQAKGTAGNVERERDVTTADEARKLTTILAIDVVGYSAAAERDQMSAARRVTTLRSRIEQLAAEFGGRIFSTAGDGFMLEFPLTSAAVRAAIALLQEAVAPASALPRVRAGAHLGEVIIDGDDLLGHGVNVAARLVAQAEPNALVISDAVKSQLHGEIDAPFTALGTINLPKMREPIAVHTYAPGASAAGWRGRLMMLAKRRRRELAIGAGLIGALVLAAGLIVMRQTSYVLEPIRMVAHSRQPELFPALSPDGRFVVYMVERGGALYTDTELFMRNVAGGDETQLTYTDDFNEGVSAFSPTGDRLAYARWPKPMGDEPCQIIVRVFPSGIDRQATTCQGSGPNRLSWTADGRSLVYVDNELEGGDETSHITMLNLDTGEVRNIVPPMERGMGDTAPVLSPDGTRVVFVRYVNPEHGDVFVHDLRNQRLTRITETNAWAQAAWADSDNLFVILGPTGRATEVWLKRADGHGDGQRLLPGLTARLTRPYVAGGLLALQAEISASNLWRSGRSGAATVTNGNQDDSGADFSRDGTLAFVSTQSETWIYMQAPGQPPRRLVDITAERAFALRWSQDGRRLVIGGQRDGRLALSIVDVASGVIQPVEIPTTEQVGNPAWSADGRSLIYASTTPEGPRIFRHQLDGETPPVALSGPGWHEAIETPEGVFAVSRNQPGIWRLAPGRDPELVLPGFRTELDNAVLETLREWTVVNGRFYFLEQQDDYPARGRPDRRVLSRAISGGSTVLVAEIEGGTLGSLAVDPTTGDVVYRVPLDEQYDIGVIPFRRR